VWCVRLAKPLPGVRSEIFVFFSELEAEEFASCIHAKFDNAETESGIVGDPTEVFENWSM
jgi:hypothetical protein